MKVSYELHVQSKGRWNIERIISGGTREAAVDYARQLYAEPQISGVRVICEKYNPDTNDSSEVVIFDTTKKIGEKVKIKQQPKAASAVTGPASAQSTARAAKGTKKVPAKKPPTMTGIAVLSTILVTAIAALVIAVSRGAEVLGSL